MKHLRIWSFLAACTASVSLLLGGSTNWKAILCDNGTNEVFPVDLPLGQLPTAENSLNLTSPQYVAITPDATRAVVTVNNSSPNPNIFSLDLTTTPVSIATSASLSATPFGVAIAPDGLKTYVTDELGNVQVLRTSDLSVLATIPQINFGTYTPSIIALSPNKPEGYVTTYDNRVFVIDTSTDTVPSYYDLTGSPISNYIAVTPNGSEIYVSDYLSNTIFYINTGTGTVNSITGLSSATSSRGIAIAPDGTSVYVAQQLPGEGLLTKIDTATHTIVKEFTVPTVVQSPEVVALTPDGKTACVTDSGFSTSVQYMAFIALQTSSPYTLQLISSAQLKSRFLGIAITPDQAPTARFSFVISGPTVTFDASASSSPIGGIATYAWDFGDGQTATTTTPICTHIYSVSGTYTVTLTVTNTAGTSTRVTYTGQTVSNEGGPSAVLAQSLTVNAAGVAHFKGKVHRDHKEKKVYLKTRWTHSLIPHTKKFILFDRHTKIDTTKGSKHKKTLQLHPRHFPHKITKKYRHYLDHKYNIRVVGSGHISEPTYVHVVKE